MKTTAKTALVAILGALLALITSSCTITRTVGSDSVQMAQKNSQPFAAINGGGQVGQMVSSLEAFGNQPTNPTPDAVRIPWEQAFGPGELWVNDFGHGRAQVQIIPAGEVILFDQYHKWAWRIKCHNRVVPLVAPQAPAPQPITSPTRSSSSWSFSFNPPIDPCYRPMRPMPMYRPMCPPRPMPRPVYVPYCPPPLPCQPRPMCR